MGAMDVPTSSAMRAYSIWLKLEGLVYVPDNFALTIQSAKRMYGSLISAATAPAIFVRSEEGIS